MTSSKRKPLANKTEAALVKAISESFATESDAFRAGALQWGRKQLKLEGGLRATKPPVPGILQNADKSKTQKTLRRIAEAIGAKFETAVATPAPAAAKPAAAKPTLTIVKPDPKPAKTTRSSSRTPASRERKAATKPAPVASEETPAS